MNSTCIVCGHEFSQHSSFQRKTCSTACKYALIKKSNLHGSPPKVVKPPKPPRPQKTEPQRKLPPEPSDRKSVHSSFTEEELSFCRLIVTSLNEFPRCACKNSEQKVRIETIGNEFKATCDWCGFEAATVGGRWVGVETIRLDHRRLVI